MLNKTAIALGLLLTLNCYSQEELITFKNTLKTSSSFLKDVLPIVNEKNDDVSLFLIDAKYIYGYLLNDKFEIKSELKSEDRSRMFKTIIGHSIKNNNDYRIFLTNKSHDKFSTINFSYGTDESSIKEFELEKDNEKFVQSVSVQNKFYLISIIKYSSIFKVYSFDDEGNYSVNIVDFAINNFIDKKGKMAVLYDLMPGLYSSNSLIDIKKINEKTPSSIEIASEFVKLYIRNTDIIFSFDENTNTTQTVTFNLETFEKKVNQFTKPLELAKSNQKKTNSFINDENIFLIASTDDELVFRTQNFESGTLVKEYVVNVNDTIAFKNSPIIQEGGAYDSYREMDKTKKFLRKITSGDVGVSVNSYANGYKIVLGGKKEIRRGGGGMMPMGFGMPMASFGGVSVFFNPVYFAYNSYVNTKSTYVNCLFDQNLNHLEGVFPKNEFDKIKDYNEEDRFASQIGETVFKHKGYFIKGVYFSESEEYRLRKFSN